MLDQNWTGSSTKPSPRLYPHQWSWDSAFVAIGNRFDRLDRAIVELETLFTAQWSNGMIPHIVFDASVAGYHPSKEWWDSPSADAAPASVWTSGMCQPPVHALAVQRLAEVDPVRVDLARCVEHLEAWHDYLFERRVLSDGLVEIWHPWESGMDNSPLWDSALADLERTHVPDYQRVDTEHAGAEERPTESDYDGYAILVDQLRQGGYEPSSVDALGFRVHDVLFNACLAHAEMVLAQLLERLGEPASRHRERAQALVDAMERHLWDNERFWFFDRDAATGAVIPTPAATGAVALIAELSDDVFSRAVQTLGAEFLIERSDGATVLPTVAPSDPSFEPRRYWRGPAWINVTWLTALGLGARGEDELAASLRAGILELTDGAGMREYFDPHTGDGLGGDDFSWTAALVLDVLEDANL